MPETFTLLLENFGAFMTDLCIQEGLIHIVLKMQLMLTAARNVGDGVGSPGQALVV